MATEPTKPAAAKPASKPAKPTRAAAKAQDPKGPDLTAVESRLAALETGLDAAEQRLAKRAAALEARIGAIEERETTSPRVRMPAGLVESTQHGLNRVADWIRHNPVTTLILFVAFLLVAIFS